VSQLDLFADPEADADLPVEPPSSAPFDASVWLWAKNPTSTRCDRCTHWTRTMANYWGECSKRATYEHEYGKCSGFTAAEPEKDVPPHQRQPLDELSPLHQWHVTAHPDGTNGRKWRAGYRMVYPPRGVINEPAKWVKQ